MNKWIIFLVLVLGTGAFFFFQSDEKRLKKKTLKILHIVTNTSSESSTIVLLRKTQSVIKFIHFSVHYEVKWESRSYQNRSLNRLRSDLQAWFRQAPADKVIIPSQKSLKVTLKNKKASVDFLLHLTYKDQTGLCKVNVHWEKEKSWLIHKINALCHKKDGL